MKRYCAECHHRPAVSRYRGKYAVRRHHELCRQCYIRLVDQLRAEVLEPRERNP